MTPEQAKQEYENEMREFQNSTHFPDHHITDILIEAKKTAFRYFSPSSLKMSVDGYCKLHDKVKGFTLAEMSVILPIMEQRSMKQYDLEYLDYIALQRQIEAAATAWGEMVQPKLDSLQRKYQTMVRISNPSGGTPSRTMKLGQA